MSKLMLKVGDQVRPRPEWRANGLSGPVPSGRIVKVEPWGKGQIVYLDGPDKRPFLGGVFERAEP